MVLSAVFVLDCRGKTLIARNFRGDVPMSAIDRFMPLLARAEDDDYDDADAGAYADAGPAFSFAGQADFASAEGSGFALSAPPAVSTAACAAAVAAAASATAASRTGVSEFPPPILFDAATGVHYLYTRYNNLYFVALTRKNSNALCIFTFLHKLIDVFTEYFQRVEEESVRDNFVIIYELLDEMMDFGYPQTTESKILREYITQESHRLEVAVRPPTALTNAVSWRSEGIKYRKNEVFLDVVESVNMLAAANGTVLNSEVLGAVRVRCFLSGMPELRLGLNDKGLFDASSVAGGFGGGVGIAALQQQAQAQLDMQQQKARGASSARSADIEDVKFHQCVQLSRFESDRTIAFIPPDGEFELLTYRLATPLRPLIWCEVVVEWFSDTRVEYMVRAKAQFKRRSVANNIEISVPVPDDADTPKFKSSAGSPAYKPETNSIVWRIKSLQGGTEALLRAHFGLPTVRAAESDSTSRATSRRPVTVKFEIPYFTLSGLQVRYLKVIDKSGYQALPWVRYITQNGNYQLRMPDAVRSGTRVMRPL